MVTLRALQAYEGAGVLEQEDGSLLYVEFPFGPENKYPCTEEELERLIHRMEFQRLDQKFDNDYQAFEFIHEKANEEEDPLINEEDEATILDRYNSMSPRNMEAIVDAIEQICLIESKAYSDALRGLERIISLRPVKETPSLYQKVSDLMLQCYRALRARNEIKLRKERRMFKPLASASYPWSQGQFSNFSRV